MSVRKFRHAKSCLSGGKAMLSDLVKKLRCKFLHKEDEAMNSIVRESQIWDAKQITGTSVSYVVTPNSHFADQCDYFIDTLRESRSADVRAHRQERRQTGGKLHDLKPNSLHEELVVIFGPELSAIDAIRSLERLISEVRRTGLIIGRRANGDYVSEFPDGQIV